MSESPEERTEIGRVNAVIKWAEVNGVPRDDVEIVGDCILYDDGTQDVVLSNMSDDAKQLMGFFKELDVFNLNESEDADGST